MTLVLMLLIKLVFVVYNFLLTVLFINCRYYEILYYLYKMQVNNSIDQTRVFRQFIVDDCRLMLIKQKLLSYKHYIIFKYELPTYQYIFFFKKLKYCQRV